MAITATAAFGCTFLLVEPGTKKSAVKNAVEETSLGGLAVEPA